MLRSCCVAALLAWSPSAVAQELLASPPLPAPRVVAERGASPTYYRLSPRVMLPVFRGGFGAQFRSAPDDAAASVAFTFDVMGGVVARFDRASRHGLIAEVGYTFSGFSQHLASLGLGAMTGLGALADRDGRARAAGFRVALVTRFLAGVSYDRTAVGVRTGVIVGGPFYAVEIAHQVLFVDGDDHNELRLTFTTLQPFGEAP